MSKQRIRLSLIVVSAFLAAACAPAPERACMPGEQRLVNELLYFGLAKPGGVVTPDEWSEFLQSSVSPRFPEGLTAWQASGQWKSPDGSITRETSYVLNLLHSGAEPAEAAVRAVVSEYKARFQQVAVLRVRGHACTSL